MFGGYRSGKGAGSRPYAHKMATMRQQFVRQPHRRQYAKMLRQAFKKGTMQKLFR